MVGSGQRRPVLLARVSRGERTQDPENQLAPLRAAAGRLGWAVAEEIALVLSAWDDEAAAEVLHRAIAPIIAGRADVLMVWSWDRLSRGGIAEAFRVLHLLEEHHGAGFYSLQEHHLSTATIDRSSRELLLANAAWHAKWESQRRSDRLVAKATSKRTRSASLGERAIWGPGRLATPAEVEAVKEAAGKESVRAIAARLGLSKSQVGRILRGEVKSA